MKSNQKGFAPILLMIGVLIFSGIFVFAYFKIKISPDLLNLFKLNSILPTSALTNKNQRGFEVYQVGEGVNKKIFSYNFPYDSNGTDPSFQIDSKNSLYFKDDRIVYKYSFDSRKTEVVFEDTNTKNRISNIVWENSNLYITSGLKYDYKNPNFEEYENERMENIFELNPTTKETKTLGSKHPDIYESYFFLSRINDFDLVMGAGGDGCGSWKYIYKLKSEKFTLFDKSGGGCAELPRFLGVDPDKGLVMVSFLDFDLEKNANKYGELYYKLFNGEVQSITDLKSKSEYFVGTAYDEINKKVIVIPFESNSVYSIDLKNKTIDTIQAKTKINFQTNNYQIFDNNLYWEDITFDTYGVRGISKMNLQTGEVNEKWWSISNSNNIKILGLYNGKILISTELLPKDSQ